MSKTKTDTTATCPEIDNCWKIKMVRDKDMAGDWQYAQAISETCRICTERGENAAEKMVFCTECGVMMQIDPDSKDPETGLFHGYRCHNCGHTKEID